MNRVLSPLPGYPEPYGTLAACLKDATEDWRGEIPSDLGSDATTWRVRPGGQSIGAIFLHIIQVEIWWLEIFPLERYPTSQENAALLWDQIDVDSGKWPDPPAEPLSWYFDYHDKVRARTLESIKEWPSPTTMIKRDGESNDYNLSWVLGHVIQHESYHGGQIVLIEDLYNHRNPVEN